MFPRNEDIDPEDEDDFTNDFTNRARAINDTNPVLADRLARLMTTLEENRDLVRLFDSPQHYWPNSIDENARRIDYYAIDDKDRLVLCAPR